jgi:hypothetical protein
MQTPFEIKRVSCVVCDTRIGNQKTKLQNAQNNVSKAYCIQNNIVENNNKIKSKSSLTTSYNFRNAFG